MKNLNYQLTNLQFRYSQRNSWNNRSARRRGSVIVYVGLGLFAFIGMASLSVDMGNLYGRKAQSQIAADAAALAGANEMRNFRDANANNAARTLAKSNGYDHTKPGVIVDITSPVPGHPTQFKVRVSRPEPLFFARIFGLLNRPVSSTATAEYQTLSPLSITGGGVYGQPTGPTNLSVFGPSALYSYGDFRSTMFLDDGSPNPDYEGKGYNFTVNVPGDYTDTVVEIYDPDCHNAGGERFVLKNVRIDELRKPYNENQAGAIAPSDITTTRYRLYHDPTGQGNPNELQLIDEKSYGDDASTDMKWAPAFTFNRANYAGGNFLLNVTTTSGSSENAFNLRARPANEEFKPDNRTSITADGYVPMNFNDSNSSGIELGEVPQAAAGKQLTIRKFDTDVGSLDVYYHYVANGVSSTPIKGQLSTNGEFYTDTISLPPSYPGGKWFATYNAGANDTSVWEMSYSGGSPGKPGPLRLVQ